MSHRCWLLCSISRTTRASAGTGESYGEDPTLVAALGTAYAKGLHSGETAGRRTEGAAKHFLGFHASQGGIHGAHSELTPRTLREVFAKPFQAAITEAGLKGIMPCYCSLDGEPVTASRAILRGLLRGEMGFSGVCVSDYSAVSNVFRVQHVCESLPLAGLRCLRAGLDVELPSAAAFGAELLELFRSGKADVSVLDEAVLRVLTAKFRMGLFEEPFALQGEELRRTVCGGPGRDLSLRSARESIVLLKNDGSLPLSPQIRRLAVIGPHAADASAFFGGYTDVSMAQAAFAAPAGAERTAQGDPVARIPGTKVQSADGEAFRCVLDRQQPGCPTLLDALREALPGVEIQVVRGYEAAGGSYASAGRGAAGCVRGPMPPFSRSAAGTALAPSPPWAREWTEPTSICRPARSASCAWPPRPAHRSSAFISTAGRSPAMRRMSPSPPSWKPGRRLHAGRRPLRMFCSER